jgi:subtilase-type serine protease
MKNASRRAGRVATLLLSVAFPAAALAQTAGDPSDPETWKTPEYRAQWGLDLIDAADAYAKGLDGSGVKIGVVDSGIDPDHPEFQGRIGGGYDYVAGSETLSDPLGHGTQITSIIAANRDGIGMHGVAPGATIVSARMFRGDEENDDYPDLPAAAVWGDLLRQGARIINNSWGTIDLPITAYSREEWLTVASQSIDGARAVVAGGALMIFGTGNDVAYQPGSPAGLPYYFPELESGWLAVTSVVPSGDIPFYANFCGVAKNWCLAAPGGGTWWVDQPHPDDPILAADAGGGYAWVSGTSLAAPHVAGAAALVWQMFPYMTADQVRQVLLGTATDLGAPGVDDRYGYGLLNVGKAVRGPGAFDWGDLHVIIDEGTSVWENDITGEGGLIKSGAGTLVLMGDSTYGGDTRIDGGVLAIGGSIASDTFVEQSGLLAGTGIVHGDVDNAGAVYAGWNILGGVLTVDGNYRQRENSWLLVELGAPDGTSRLDVTGTAAIEGGAVDVLVAPGGYRGDGRHTILSAGGGVTGRFAEVCNCYAFLDFALAYDPAAVHLDVARNEVAFADLASSGNGAAVAGTIESLGIGNILYDNAIGIFTGEAPFASLSGEIHASLSGLLIEQSSLLSHAATARLRSAFADAGAAPLPVMAYGPDGAAPAAATTDRFAVWSQVLGARGEIDANGSAAGIDHSVGGLLFGGDAAVGDAWRVGVLGGYSHTSFEQSLASGSSKNIHLGIYGGAEWGALALRTGAAYSWHDVETRREAWLGWLAAIRPPATMPARRRCSASSATGSRPKTSTWNPLPAWPMRESGRTASPRKAVDRWASPPPRPRPTRPSPRWAFMPPPASTSAASRRRRAARWAGDTPSATSCRRQAWPWPAAGRSKPKDCRSPGMRWCWKPVSTSPSRPRPRSASPMPGRSPARRGITASAAASP